jgi:hypothetical protein
VENGDFPIRPGAALEHDDFLESIAGKQFAAQ